MVLNCSLFFKAKNVIPDLSRRYCTHCTVLAIITKIKKTMFYTCRRYKKLFKTRNSFFETSQRYCFINRYKNLEPNVVIFFSFLKMLRTSQTQFIARQDKFSEAKFATYPKNGLCMNKLTQ